jgi:hypothetical protein
VLSRAQSLQRLAGAVGATRLHAASESICNRDSVPIFDADLYAGLSLPTTEQYNDQGAPTRDHTGRAPRTVLQMAAYLGGWHVTQARISDFIKKDIDRLLLGVANHVRECGGIEGAEASIAFLCSGWDDDPRGLWDIPEVHEYFLAIHRKFPSFPFFLVQEEMPLAELYFRILAQPGRDQASMERMARYLNEAMSAICEYCKEYRSATGRAVNPMSSCCRLSGAAGFEVKPKILEREFKKRGML